MVLAGGAIPANGSCAVTVNITAILAGNYLNTTGLVTSTNADSAGPATASLFVPGIIQQVPTLSDWALILLAGLLAVAGGVLGGCTATNVKCA